MMSLWIGAALLSAVALLFIFWPLMRTSSRGEPQAWADEINARLAENIRLFREHIAELDAQLAEGRIEQAQYDQLVVDQERALLEDEASVRANVPTTKSRLGAQVLLGVAVLAIAGAVALYQQLGSSTDVEIRLAQELKMEGDAADIKAGRNPDPIRTRQLNRLIEARLAEEPDHLQYWFFLARNYMELSEFDKAVSAYQQVLQRDKESTMVMGELAQAMFMREGRKTNPAINDLVGKVLKAEPDNTMALGLAGINAFSNKDYLAAIKHWERVIKLVGEESPTGLSLASGIEHAVTMFLSEGGTIEQLDAARKGRQIGVMVSLAEGLDVSSDQVVYVYARAYQGAKMPLAIDRVTVGELPRVVLLNEAMAMTPAMSLGNTDKVELVARVSQDGTATAKAGDWEGSVGPVDLTTSGPVVNVTIDRQVK